MVEAESTEVEVAGFPDAPIVQLYWLGRDPIRVIANHVRDLIRGRFPNDTLLRVTCLAPPEYRTELRSATGASTGTLHSMIVVWQLSLRIRKAEGGAEDIEARLGYLADNLDEPASMGIRYKFGMACDEDWPSEPPNSACS